MDVLAKPANRHVITKIKAAITAGIRPTSMIFHEQPTAPWKPFDFKLLEAYQILQDELCPKCGHPIWLCRSSSNSVEFKVGTAFCAAERRMKEYEDSKRPQKERAKAAEKKDWGRFHYTSPSVPEALPDGKLPTRAEYYKDLTANA